MEEYLKNYEEDIELYESAMNNAYYIITKCQDLRI